MEKESTKDMMFEWFEYYINNVVPAISNRNGYIDLLCGDTEDLSNLPGGEKMWKDFIVLYNPDIKRIHLVFKESDDIAIKSIAEYIKKYEGLYFSNFNGKDIRISDLFNIAKSVEEKNIGKKLSSEYTKNTVCSFAVENVHIMSGKAIDIDLEARFSIKN